MTTARVATAAALVLHLAVWACWQASHVSGWPRHAGPVASSSLVSGEATHVRWLPQASALPRAAPEAAPPEPEHAPLPVQQAAAPAGRQGSSVDYLPSEVLSDSPRPEHGWVLDEDALASVRQARLTMRVWVSAEGRIDRVALLSAEPPGAWAERTLQRVPDTPMSPGWKEGRAVASTLVVEIASEIESFR